MFETEAELAAWLDKREQTLYNRLLLNRSFTGIVTAVQGIMPQWQIQVRRDGEEMSDGHWHKATVPGWTPQVGDQVDLVWRDDNVAHVQAPLSSTAFVSQGSAKLAPTVTLAVATASVSFSNIPQSFTHLWGAWRARGTAAGFNDLGLRLNNDSTNNYNVQIVSALGTTVSTSFVTTSRVRIGSVGVGGGFYSSGWFYIHDYTIATGGAGRRLLNWQGWRNDGGGAGAEWGAADWQNTIDPVTSVTLLPSGGNLDVGCIFSLYGI